MSLTLTGRRIWAELPRSRNPYLEVSEGVLPVHSSCLDYFQDFRGTELPSVTGGRQLMRHHLARIQGHFLPLPWIWSSVFWRLPHSPCLQPNKTPEDCLCPPQNWGFHTPKTASIRECRLSGPTPAPLLCGWGSVRGGLLCSAGC